MFIWTNHGAWDDLLPGPYLLMGPVLLEHVPEHPAEEDDQSALDSPRSADRDLGRPDLQQDQKLRPRPEHLHPDPRPCVSGIQIIDLKLVSDGLLLA